MIYPVPDPRVPHDKQDPCVLLCMCVWAEARGEPDQGKLAVAEVIRNRAARPSWWGRDIAQVIVAPWQFSSFNRSDPNREAMLRPLEQGPRDRAIEVWAACWRAAAFVFHARPWEPAAGVARGADHYHVRGVQTGWIKKAEASGVPPVALIGRHVFWALGPDGSAGTGDDPVRG